jgi:hypothetical protein
MVLNLLFFNLLFRSERSDTASCPLIYAQYRALFFLFYNVNHAFLQSANFQLCIQKLLRNMSLAFFVIIFYTQTDDLYNNFCTDMLILDEVW